MFRDRHTYSRTTLCTTLRSSSPAHNRRRGNVRTQILKHTLLWKKWPLTSSIKWNDAEQAKRHQFPGSLAQFFSFSWWTPFLITASTLNRNHVSHVTYSYEPSSRTMGCQAVQLETHNPNQRFVCSIVNESYQQLRVEKANLIGHDDARSKVAAENVYNKSVIGETGVVTTLQTLRQVSSFCWPGQWRRRSHCQSKAVGHFVRFVSQLKEEERPNINSKWIAARSRYSISISIRINDIDIHNLVTTGNWHRQIS